MSEKIVRTGIIGQGRSGKDIHAFSLSHLKEMYEITAVADALPERRGRAEQEYGCDAYEDYHDLLGRDDLDLIINASPSHMHVPITLEILNSGFHCLCEKPLARTAKEVDQLIEASHKSGNILTVFQQSRFSPAFMQLQKVIGSGVLGRIVQVSISFNNFSRRWDWQTMQKYNGGNLLNTGPHPMDQALQLFGTDDIPEVVAMMDRANSFGDAEDYVKIILRGKVHPVVDVEISSCDAYPVEQYHVQGTQGGLKGGAEHLDWKYFRPEEAPEQRQDDQPLESEDGTPAYCREELTWYEDSWDLSEEQRENMLLTMSRELYTRLYNTITEGRPLDITPIQIRQQITVIEKGFQQNPEFNSLRE